MRVCVCVMDSLSLPISHGVCRPEIFTTLCLFELIKAVRKSCVMESEFFKSIYKMQTVSVCTKQIFFVYKCIYAFTGCVLLCATEFFPICTAACEYWRVCVCWCPCLGVTHYQKRLINTSLWAYQRNVSKLDIAAFGDIHQHVWCTTITNNNCCQSVWTHVIFSPLLFFIWGCFWKQEERRKEVAVAKTLQSIF